MSPWLISQAFYKISQTKENILNNLSYNNVLL